MTISQETHDALTVYDVAKTAKLLGVSVATVRRLIPELPPRIKLSERRYGWLLSDLNAWIDSRIEQAKTQP